MNFLDELKSRGIINNITNEEKVKEFFQKKDKALYIGFDPTAISLQMGNYAMICLLKRFKQNGFKTYAVLGGATGMIGDPSGKTSERNLLDKKTLEQNCDNIKKQLEKYSGAEIFNNYDIYKDMNVLDFLRDIGKSINVNHILEKEIVKKRLEYGLSFTEFSYSIIQGYDFYYLYKNKNVSLQLGGSDQWANITAGTDFIRKQVGDKNTACGMTINLLVKADGTKFGKSEKGAIYLDKKLTSPYAMYQMLINSADADLKNLYNYFSFKTLDEIDKILDNHQKEPFKKMGQKILAEEIITTIHGKEEYLNALKISECIFKNEIEKLTVEELQQAFISVPSYECDKKETNIVDLLVESKIVESKRIARELIDGKSIYVNNKLIDNKEEIIKKADGYNKSFSLIRKGKKNYFLINWK